jgi:hypothetical protein
MPDWPTITDRVILFAAVALILYNVVAGVMGGGSATISARMQFHGYRFPILVGAAFGLLCHWWWPVFGPRQ